MSRRRTQRGAGGGRAWKKRKTRGEEEDRDRTVMKKKCFVLLIKT